MFTVLKRKIHTLKIFLENGITPPSKLGDKILILATAPCVDKYFKYESVREQFRDYDLAIINFMLLHSQKEVFEMKPKYIILFDPIFYTPGLKGECIDFDAQKVTKDILEKINWECYVVTTALADFKLCNENLKYIRLSFLSCGYTKAMSFLFRKNWLNMGVFNVIQGALFFAITFGYKDVAILGCPYKRLKFQMKPDGIHIDEHRHYYDKDAISVFISNDELAKRKISFTMNLNKRAYKSAKILWDLRKYADELNVNVTNYSDESEIDAFKVGELIVR